MAANTARNDLNMQIAKTLGSLIMIKMFIALFTNKLGKSLQKRYID